MPRLSRFLFGRWTNSELECAAETSCAYTQKGAGYQHSRTVSFPDANSCVIDDEVSSVGSSVVVRWHLIGDWTMKNDRTIEGKYGELAIHASNSECEIELSETPYSSHYAKVEMIKLLKVTIKSANKEAVKCQTILHLRTENGR